MTFHPCPREKKFGFALFLALQKASEWVGIDTPLYAILCQIAENGPITMDRGGGIGQICFVDNYCYIVWAVGSRETARTRLEINVSISWDGWSSSWNNKCHTKALSLSLLERRCPSFWRWPLRYLWRSEAFLYVAKTNGGDKSWGSRKEVPLLFPTNFWSWNSNNSSRWNATFMIAVCPQTRKINIAGTPVW